MSLMTVPADVPTTTKSVPATAIWLSPISASKTASEEWSPTSQARTVWSDPTENSVRSSGAKARCQVPLGCPARQSDFQRLEVDHADAAVRARREGQPSVRGQSQVDDPFRMVEHCERLPGRQIPSSERMIPRGRQEGPAI